jgi:hypothetical protein
MKVPRDFSERLIQANPQAMELQTEHFSEIDHELFQAMEKAKILIAYISSILGDHILIISRHPTFECWKRCAKSE